VTALVADCPHPKRAKLWCGPGTGILLELDTGEISIPLTRDQAFELGVELIRRCGAIDRGAEVAARELAEIVSEGRF